MRCTGARRHMSAWIDGDLPRPDAAAVGAHLARCPACAARAAELREVSRLVGDLPRLQAAESVAQDVLTRLEMEQRGPGLALLLRGFGAARPFIMPSLVPAALVLLTLLAAGLALDTSPRLPGPFERWGALPALGTESNPLFPSAAVDVPQERGETVVPDVLLAGGGEESLFLETVVARDGTVSTVTVLQGDAEKAAPLVAALRQQRYEPVRYRGRPVAVSIYRLISSTEVSLPSL